MKPLIKKLSLNRETLKQLDLDLQRRVAGGEYAVLMNGNGDDAAFIGITVHPPIVVTSIVIPCTGGTCISRVIECV